MDAALIEITRDIPKEEIDRVVKEGGYSRWTYYTDSEAGQAGVIFANDDSIALYHPGKGGVLELGPAGMMELQSIQYVPSGHQLYIERSGKYLTLQVFSDPSQAGQDTATPQQWQQFLAEHSVRKLTGKSGTGSSRRKPIIAATAVAALAAVAIVAISVI
jgi:hypothetical protein